MLRTREAELARYLRLQDETKTSFIILHEEVQESHDFRLIQLDIRKVGDTSPSRKS